jgi:hypothetical protein
MRRLLFAFVATISGLGVTAAQEARPPAQAVVGEVLSRARESGALERVLGTQHLFFRKTLDAGAVVVLRGELIGDAEAPAGVRLRMILLGLSGTLAGRELQAGYEVGFDGAVRRFEVVQAYQGRGGEAQGVVKGELLEVATRVAGAGGVSKRQLGWSRDAVPFVVALFAAQLHDQGLPDDFRFRMFEGESLRLNEHESALVVGPGEGSRVQVTCRKRLEGGPQTYQLVLETQGEQAGQLVQIRVGESGLMDPISQAEAARLLGKQAGGDPDPQASPPGEAPTPSPDPAETPGDD